MGRNVIPKNRGASVLAVLLLLGAGGSWAMGDSSARAADAMPAHAAWALHAADGVDPVGDGLTPAQRLAIYGSDPAATSEVNRDIVIVHRSDPIVYFGFYRANQMTQPGWDLYERALNWANGFKKPADTKVWLATYNGRLDPRDSPELGGIAVYNRLIDNMGFLKENIEVGGQSTIETQNFDGFDIVLYTWIFPRDATNVIKQNKPFVTMAAGQTDELSIGTGQVTMHEFRSDAYVLNNAHYVTEPYKLGKITLQGGMWIDASTAADDGIALIAADDRPPTCSGKEKLRAKCKPGGKLTAKIKKGTPGGLLSVSLDTGKTRPVNLNNKGKGKARFRGVPSGRRTVTLVECNKQKKTDCPK